MLNITCLLYLIIYNYSQLPQIFTILLNLTQNPADSFLTDSTKCQHSNCVEANYEVIIDISTQFIKDFYAVIKGIIQGDQIMEIVIVLNQTKINESGKIEKSNLFQNLPILSQIHLCDYKQHQICTLEFICLVIVEEQYSFFFTKK
ncbi:unnamed protein product [Paramecium octaurelia]|uniref:Uncharacterized protein n=1 Tax=Paramecium octaurelia TaxID=43137 RepID=A0A8S1Y987_PAROT|nr:unnamed protein product [Paramecium octaurelia]